jgi:hypothetical protein
VNIASSFPHFPFFQTPVHNNNVPFAWKTYPDCSRVLSIKSYLTEEPNHDHVSYVLCHKSHISHCHGEGWILAVLKIKGGMLGPYPYQWKCLDHRGLCGKVVVSSKLQVNGRETKDADTCRTQTTIYFILNLFKKGKGLNVMAKNTIYTRLQLCNKLLFGVTIISHASTGTPLKTKAIFITRGTYILIFSLLLSTTEVQ